MCVMPAEQHPPTEAIVEFGAPEPAPGARRRWSASEFLTGIGADRRTVPLAATVGAVALFASLISEWQVTELDNSELEQGGIGGDRPVPSGIADLGALGSGYLVGLFVLAVAVVLMLSGPPAGRRYARLIGLTVAGVQAALLAGAAHAIGEGTRSPLGLFAAGMTEEQVHLTYGRGIWCGLVGVAAVALALWLAGRHLHQTDEQSPEPPEVWSWRRPRTGPDDAQPDAPIDLTVTSSTPFTSRSEDRDGPGISR
jgi:hypothetical protein